MEIPQSWRDALARLHANGFPEAIIGGGALRDLDHGVPVKDVDFFVMARPFQLATLNKAFGREGRVLVNESVADYLGFSDDVVMVVDYSNDDDIPFQVIVSCPDCSSEQFLEYQLERFDLGLCRIAYDGGFHRHETYEEDASDKVLRIRDPRRIPRSITRAARIQAKYPGYRIILPDGVEYATTADGFELAL
jgi:hypothetical protein